VKDVGRMNVTLYFRVVNKSDAFIENKRHLGELLELQARISEPIPLIAQQIAKEVI
jgi:hypothetical protein